MQPNVKSVGPSLQLDRAPGAVPLYAQVAGLLGREIALGKYKPGDRLPSEPFLSKELRVSRATVTKAFQEMQAEGLIERWQGRGTFVSHSPSRHSLSDLSGFSAVTESSGAVPTHRLVSHGFVQGGGPGDPMAAAFPAGTTLIELERVRLSDGSPVGFHRVLLPADIAVPANLGDRDVVAQPGFSLYAALEAAGHAPATADQSLEAVPCPSVIATHLGVDAGQPMMRARRHTHDHAGLLIEVVEAHYVGTLYEYHTRLSAVSRSTREGQVNEDQAHGNGRHRDHPHVVGERLRRRSTTG